MADVIDWLLLFWIFLTIGVCVLGSIYEKSRLQQLELKQKEQRKKDLQQQKYDSNLNWSNQTRYSQQDQYYNNINSNQQQYYSTNIDSPTISSYSRAQSNQQYSPSSINKQQSSYFNYNSPIESSGQYNNNNNINNNQLNQELFNNIEQSQQSNSTLLRQLANNSYYSNDSNLQYYNNNELNNFEQLTSYEASIPIATGFNQDCVDWVNNILYLFYTHNQKYGPIIAENIYRSLNEKLSNIISSSQDYNNLLVEFKGINRNLSSKPELTNVRTEIESDKSVSINCKVYNRRLVLDLTIEKVRQNNVSTNLVGSASATGSNSGAYNMSGIDYSNEMRDSDERTLNYELILENLEGKLKSVAMLNDKLIVIQFMEKPEAKILLKPKFPPTSSMGSHNRVNNLINEDILVSIILQTITQVVVDLYFGDDVDFPQYKQQQQSLFKSKFDLLKGSANELKRQIKHDFFGALISSNDNSKERKIFIKILKAKNINYNQNVTCLLELDQPYQQAVSSIKQGSNPFWDEHFLFNINDKSSEVRIELWDSICLPDTNNNNSTMSNTETTSTLKKGGSLSRLPNQTTSSSSNKHHNQNKWSKSEVTSNGKFLGLVSISIDELKKNPIQKVSLPLQSSKQSETIVSTGGTLTMGDNLSNSVGGELMVELLFLEHSSPLASGATSGGSGLQKSQSTSSAVSYQHGDVVSIDRKLTPSGYVITTTTITKPTTTKDNKDLKSLSQSQLLLVRNQSPISSTSEQSELLDLNLDAISSQALGSETQSQKQTQNDPSIGGRSRSRSRSRSFLRAIRKRFSFSRTRSRSVGESGMSTPAIRSNQSPSHNNLDAISIETRSRASSEVSITGRAKSVPASRDLNEVPLIVINRGGRASETASAFTFAQPKSQLVIECVEPKLSQDGTVDKRGRLRHYAVPDTPSNKAKWRRRGTKLHLFNEHQFIACHLAGSSTCHLCGRVFSRRPGKQGYKCRNCHLLSHKQCHAKVDHQCPYATKDGLKLEYIDADPPASLVNETNQSRRGDSLPRETQRTNVRGTLGSKSISMDVDDR